VFFMIFCDVFSCLAVEVLFSWPWAKRCVFAEIEKNLASILQGGPGLAGTGYR